ncbi:MAG: hypothetical protein HQK67_05230, partial [Desulfamplus sp.]|nr:hypothetical protein [Desulfamplus sp.]
MNSTRAISSLAFDKLTSIRDTKKVQVERFFVEHQKNLEFLVEAVKSLKQAAFDKLNSVHNSKKLALTKYLTNCSSDIRILSASSSMKNALDDFSSVVDSNNNFDKTLYDFFEETKYKSFFNQFADTNRYYDLMLINKKGEVVFTIKKESDLGQNILKSSTLKDSGIFRCFTQIMNNSMITSSSSSTKPTDVNSTISSSSSTKPTDVNSSVVIEDFQPYKPSG